MGDQVLITGRRLKVANPQRKRMITPDVMLHTRNVMIPVVKSVSFKQSFNIPLSQNKLQILRAQNYRNNPALLFSETPSHTLYNPLENLFKVRRLNSRKLRNQSTKLKKIYTIPEKTNIKKKSILQNSCPLKGLFFCKKKSNTLHFPNTVQFQPSKQDENLYKISSKSIKLSNTVSTVSILSVPSFKLEKKKTFANIENRDKLVPRLVSSHLQPNNSEFEINVLHYEDDNLLENNMPYFSQSHLKSANTNWSFTDNINSIKVQDAIEIPANKKSNRIIKYATENHHRWDPYEIIHDIKYSREVDSLMPSSQSKEYNNEHEVKNMEWYGRKPYDCKIKYSWQVIGTSTQTSYSLLQDLLNDNGTEDNKSAYKMCSVKYSWQIIGISTQASLHNYNDQDYWNGMLLAPNKNYKENNVRIDNNETDCTKLQNYSVKYSDKRLKRYLILNNQQTQTIAEKGVQADTNDCNAKYSWHNLLKQYL